MGHAPGRRGGRVVTDGVKVWHYGVAIVLVGAATMVPSLLVSWISGVSFWLLWAAWWFSQAFIALVGAVARAGARSLETS